MIFFLNFKFVHHRVFLFTNIFFFYFAVQKKTFFKTDNTYISFAECLQAFSHKSLLINLEKKYDNIFD